MVLNVYNFYIMVVYIIISCYNLQFQLNFEVHIYMFDTVVTKINIFWIECLPLSKKGSKTPLIVENTSMII
jgi:hypothetical protein